MKALDEKFGPKDQRAKDLGFGDKTYYHGTTENFDEFDPDKARNGWEAFIAEKKGDAREFGKRLSEGGKPIIKELKLRGVTKDPYMELKELGIIERDVMGKARYNKGPNAGQIVDPKNSWVGVELPGVRDHLKTNGIDNAKMTELGYTKKGPEGSPTIAVGDAAFLRDVNAAFDPRFKDSRNLLAGIAAGGLTLTQLLKMLREQKENQDQ